MYLKDGDKVIDVELQSRHQDALGKRTRYYQSMVDCDSLMKGEDYTKLKESYVLFICKRDPFEEGEPVYPFSMRDPSGRALGDGGHIVFFNCSYKGEDAYGRLANDLTLPDFAKIADPVLMDTVKSGKIGERRNEVMTGLSKELYEKGVAMGREADIIALLKDGRLQPKDIAEILVIPLEDVLALKKREGI